MTSFGLQSITIQDFRSIKGRVTIPLDASIVLVHGVNGAGKTSVLSALELALTGETTGLVGTSGVSRAHLVHRGAEEAQVLLTYETDEEVATGRIRVSNDGETHGEAILSAEDRATFSERCYLAQSTVGRLLEIYQHKIDGQSPLTRFVKELLGLDRLEALIDGLYPAGDRRRIRNLIPELKALEVEAKALGEESTKLAQKRRDRQASVTRLQDELVGVLSALHPQDDGRFAGSTARELLDIDPQRGDIADELAGLRAAQQDLDALRKRANAIPSPESEEEGWLEEQLRSATEAVELWRGTVGAPLEELMQSLNSRFQDLPSASSDPVIALEAARTRVDAELARFEASLQGDWEAQQSVERLSEELARLRARAARINSELTQQPDAVLDLSRALSDLAPHVHGNSCPVCERDYSEVSPTPLTDALARRIAALSSEGKRLRELLQELRNVDEESRRINSELEDVRRALLEPDGRLGARREANFYRQASIEVDELWPLVREGRDALAKERARRDALFNWRNATTQSTEVRRATSRLAESLSQPGLAEEESLQEAFARLAEWIGASMSTVTQDANRLDSAVRLRVELGAELEALDLITRQVQETAVRRRRVDSALQDFDTRRDLARRLAAEAEAAQGRVVRRVFSHSLNSIWRDLFVRLVPTEPFVPAFRVVSSSSGRVSAELETQHRDGGTGGDPRLMLSAGNLNTGAVTLFLALNLSVNPRLPWLILDDPVQSMDEVHIAQFAALVRTLAKQEGKQLIIAVHEKSLFDYLSLELSPSFLDDRLITVELFSPDGGDTETNPDFVSWRDDRLIAAG